MASAGPRRSRAFVGGIRPARADEIRAPALAIVGADDWAPIHEIAGLVESQVPGARKVVIPDAGHHPNMEHPALFDETVLGFLREVAAGWR